MNRIIFVILFICISSAASASDTFHPTVDGHPMDTCYSWGADCNATAALMFCQAQGYDDFDDFSIAYDSPPSATYSDHRLCTESYCDHFSSIVCYGGGSDTCSDQVSDYVSQCVVASNVQCDAQCGNCTCKDPCYQQRQGKVLECGSADNVQCDDSCNCTCKPSGQCSAQKQDKVSECGTIDDVQCDELCNCTCKQCAEQKQDKVSECGTIDNIQCDDFCNCTCKNSSDVCASQRAAAESECGGLYIFNEQTCGYTCNGACSQQQQAKSSECGGTQNVQCNEQCDCLCKSACLDRMKAKALECGGVDKVTCDQSCNCICKSNCGDQRSKAETECGGTNKYYMDDSTCTYWCKTDSCPDTDGDGTPDACDFCPSDPKITSSVIETYKQADGSVCSTRSQRCDGSWSSSIPSGCTYSSGLVPYCKVDSSCNAMRDGNGLSDGSGSTGSGGTGTGGAETGSGGSDANGNGNPDNRDCDLNAASSRAAFECGDLEFVVWDDYDTCRYHCTKCGVQYENAKKTCSSPIPDRSTSDPCDYVCSCNDFIPSAQKKCPMGYTMTTDCSVVCVSCDILKQQCSQSCQAYGGTTNNYCHDNNGVPDDKYCECKSVGSTNPSDFDSACDSVCAQSGCGGVKLKDAASKKCECNNCGNKYIGSNNGTGNTPSDPADSSDTNGWLSGIKQNLDNLVAHSEDTKNWQASFDKTLKEISGSSGTSSSGTSGLSGVNNRLDDVNSDLKGLKEGFSDIDIGTSVGTYDVSSGNYGTAPTDSDLPTADETKSAFGEFKPRDDDPDGYISQAKGVLGAWKLTLSDETCHFQIPMPKFNYTVDLDFCDYQQYFDMIGSLLVCLVALNEILSFV